MTIQIEIKPSSRQDVIRILQSLKNVGMVEDYEEIPTQAVFKEQQFWEVIDLLKFVGAYTDTDDAAQYLSALGEMAILMFYDLLSEKLYLLDGQRYADVFNSNGTYFSADLFLYARCAVVAKGKSYYESVLHNPTLFPSDLFFEAMLDLPEKAYQILMSKPLDYVPKFMYETGFNQAGWMDKAIVL